MTIALIVLGLLGLMFLGIPIAFCLFGMGLALLWLGDISLAGVPTSIAGSTMKFELLAIPMFVLMSNLLLKSGVAKLLFQAAQDWVGHWKGGLAVASILASAFFAAISGSSVATAATIGVIAIPEMLSRGYSQSFAYGVVAAGGTLGILIPPSVPMIVYSVITEQSTADMFMAGIVPGILLGAFFALFCVVYAYLKPGLVESAEKASWRQRWVSLWRTLPLLTLAAVILGGIYLGAFTPTEAAGVGMVSALVLTLAMRAMTWARLFEALRSSMLTTITMMMIVAGANVFGQAITYYRIPYEISNLVAENFTTAGAFLAVVAVFLFVLGLFLEAIAMLLIVVPVLLPSVMGLGIDPIWFGIMFVVLIEAALITPPVGMNLFVIQDVARTSISKVARGAFPFFVIMMLFVGLLFLVPGLALYLPLGVF